MDSNVDLMLMPQSKVEKDFIWILQIQSHRHRERLGYDWPSGKNRGKPPSV